MHFIVICGPPDFPASFLSQKVSDYCQVAKTPMDKTNVTAVAVQPTTRK